MRRVVEEKWRVVPGPFIFMNLVRYIADHQASLTAGSKLFKSTSQGRIKYAIIMLNARVMHVVNVYSPCVGGLTQYIAIDVSLP